MGSSPVTITCRRCVECPVGVGGGGVDTMTASLDRRSAPPADPTRWRRVLCVRTDHAADVVLTGPAMRSLRRLAPDARLTLLTSPTGAAVVPLLPEVDRVMVEEVAWRQGSVRQEQRSAGPDGVGPVEPVGDPVRTETDRIGRLAAAGFDAAFIFTGWAETAWPAAYACMLAGIPVRVARADGIGGSVLTHRIPSTSVETHHALRALDLVDQFAAACGRSVDRSDRQRDRLRVHPPPAARMVAHALLRAEGLDPTGGFVVACPGASSPARRYPPTSFGAAVRRLIEYGRRAVILGASSERELTAAVAAQAGPGAVDLGGRTDLTVAASIIDAAALAIVNDSVPMLLAEAMGTPMVVLYSGTELEAQRAPRHTPARVLRVETTCSPCDRLECPHEMACLDLDPAVVAGAAAGLLAS